MFKKGYKILAGIAFFIPFITYAADVHLVSTTFNALPGWDNANTVQSLQAFQKSCKVMVASNSEANFTTPSIPLTQENWRAACQAALNIKHVNPKNSKVFFEQYFQPYQVEAETKQTGLFTGYYLPQVAASLTKSAIYSVPIFARPKDLVTVKLGLFNSTWQGKKISGRLVDGRLYPYQVSRKQIDNGVLDNKVPIVAWVKTTADRFFLQVQGSGMAILPDNKKLLLAYDGDNGLPYYPIGKWFIQQQIFNRDTISMQNIHAWLLTHPLKANQIMEMDSSFVFMKAILADAPIGTQKVPLTAGYSLAVDNTMIPLGAPIWLITTVPDPDTKQSKQFERLMIAQDTGGAIRGAVRGDIYFGSGDAAEFQAGHMQNQGRYWILLPKIPALD